MQHLNRRTIAIFLVLALLPLLFVACGDDDEDAPSGSDSDEPAASEIQITVTDNAFDPETVTVPAGDSVKVNFVNEGSNLHEVEIEGLVPETQIQPGETKSFTITPEQETYRMYCEIHEDLGMEGEFIGE